MRKGIKITYEGATFEVHSEEDLEKLLRRMGLLQGNAPVAGLGRRTGKGQSRAEDLFVLLGELREKPMGIESSRVARIARIEDPRGLAGVARVWEATLGQLGFKATEAWRKVRRGRDYYWLPGPRIDKVIEEMMRAQLEGRI